MVALPIDFASDWFSGCHLTLFWPKRCKKSILDFWKRFSSLTSNTFVPAPPAGGHMVGLRGPSGGSRGHRLRRVSGRRGHFSRFKGVRWKKKKAWNHYQDIEPTLGPPTSSFCNVNKGSYSLSHCQCFLLFQLVILTDNGYEVESKDNFYLSWKWNLNMFSDQMSYPLWIWS